MTLNHKKRNKLQTDIVFDNPESPLIFNFFFMCCFFLVLLFYVIVFFLCLLLLFLVTILVQHFICFYMFAIIYMVGLQKGTYKMMDTLGKNPRLIEDIRI